jgi:hypothetical protein
MTLAFSKQLNGKATFFPFKILFGLESKKIISYEDWFSLIDKVEFPKKIIFDKLHTIRHDEKNKWKAVNLIHFVINNRTKHRYQFAPVVKCVSTQNIEITYWYNKKTQLFDLPMVVVDDKELSKKKIFVLARNDGFNSTKEFFLYFNTNFKGKIIHWTNTQY